jgi:hypothetical protein
VVDIDLGKEGRGGKYDVPICRFTGLYNVCTRSLRRFYFRLQRNINPIIVFLSNYKKTFLLGVEKIRARSAYLFWRLP